MARRLVVAMLIGCALGINRDLRNKPAGLRTHALVALGSALIVVTSIGLAHAGLRRTPAACSAWCRA